MTTAIVIAPGSIAFSQWIDYTADFQATRTKNVFEMRNFFFVNYLRMFFLSVTIMLNRSVAIKTTEEIKLKWSHLILLVSVTLMSGCIRHYHSMPAPRGHDGHHQKNDRNQNLMMEEKQQGNSHFCPKGQGKKGRC